MKKLLFAFSCLAMINVAYSQSPSVGSPGDVDFEEQNYYEIYREYEEALESDPEAFTESQIKKWERFNYFWGPRLQNEDPEHNGRFLSLIETISDYMSNYVCEESEDGNPWEILGPLSHPSNDMGRLDGLYVFPENQNIVLVGAPSSGIWRTTNALDYGNQVWTCVTDDIRFPGLGVVRFERNPHNQDHFIAATGLASGISSGYGPGPLQSFDQGETWELMESFFFDDFGNSTDSKHTRMTDVKFSPTQDSVIYAITQKQFYRTENLGETWQVFEDFPNIESGQEAYSLAVSEDGSVLFCSIFSGSDTDCMVLKSINEGETWTNIASEILVTASESMTHLPDSEFDNGLEDWDEHPYIILDESWIEYVDEGDTGIQANIQSTPTIEYRNTGPSEFSWGIWDYKWAIRAQIPPQSKISLAFKPNSGNSGGEPSVVAELVNNSTQSLLYDEIIDVFVSDYSEDLGSYNRFSKVLLTCESLEGNSTPSNVWIGKYALTTDSVEEDAHFNWANFDVVGNNIYMHGETVGYGLAAPSIDHPVFKSQDNGTTWTRTLPSISPPSNRNFPLMRVSPLLGDVKYFAGRKFRRAIGNTAPLFGNSYLHVDIRNIQVIDNNGVDYVAVVTDGGVNTHDGTTWQSLNGTNLAITQFYELGVHDRLRNTVFGGAQDGNNYKNENGAWSPIAGADIHAVEIIDTERYAVYDNGTVEIRSFAGANLKTYTHSWKMPLPIVVNQKSNYLYYGAHKTSTKPHGLFRVNLLDYEASPPNLLETTDTIQHHVHRIAVNENEPDVIFCSLSDANWPSSDVFPKRKLLRTTDGGDTWQHLDWAYDDPENPDSSNVTLFLGISQWREIGAILSDPYNQTGFG